ncbi:MULTISPECIES: hypothetical protein [unclassified Vibrio]|uniref:hypothetical protein n=1 Tax=unclassified Vibrio TaxID=2614977 RepID=UPI002964D019|nr:MULTISPECIES: hypothetical protein [unclassified Vibrio]MDW1911191.1 hypothetical protein [Vibrio sp. 707]MDW1921738.1 hypothetical protein [Vibrio sp. 736]MDW2044610.1 hypothetical protein [Vibrio sp. 708]
MLTTTEAILQGWKVAIGDMVERYFYHESAEFAREVLVSSINPTRFLIRYTTQISQREARLSVHHAVKNEAQALVVVTQKTVSRASGLVTETPMNNVLPDQLKTVEQIESKLKAYVSPYLSLAFK